MKIELVAVKESQKSVLRQMIELYEYDMSVYTNEELNEYGYYGYSYLDYYWNESNRFAYFIRCNNALCGFVLVNDYCYALRGDREAKSIAEFFIMKKYRRLGIGKDIAIQVFSLFPGKWEVDQIPGNVVSYDFWENVIDEYTNGSYEKSIIDTEDGKKQAIIFCNEVKQA
ncbi:MAG: GNAT family N-acetyltransferase [Candidatus Cloacimonetes bacterium]|nr:GNAT family N-acetyltransferase [Candidatus Cloacimonadota bacterium]